MNYFDNIAAEEDIEEAVLKVEKILGKSGRMLPTGKNIWYNATVSTQKHGILWYGDLDIPKAGTQTIDQGNLAILRHELGNSLKIDIDNVSAVLE